MNASPVRRDRRNACSTRSSSSVRLGRSVSGSLSASDSAVRSRRIVSTEAIPLRAIKSRCDHDCGEATVESGRGTCEQGRRDKRRRAYRPERDGVERRSLSSRQSPELDLVTARGDRAAASLPRDRTLGADGSGISYPKGGEASLVRGSRQEPGPGAGTTIRAADDPASRRSRRRVRARSRVLRPDRPRVECRRGGARLRAARDGGRHRSRAAPRAEPHRPARARRRARRAHRARPERALGCGRADRGRGAVRPRRDPPGRARHG